MQFGHSLIIVSVWIITERRRFIATRKYTDMVISDSTTCLKYYPKTLWCIKGDDGIKHHEKLQAYNVGKSFKVSLK